MPHINKKCLIKIYYNVKTVVFWDMMQCSLVEKYKRFGGTIFRVENECDKFL
jgi:hypothetical protein